jgi:hypothetical protein
MKKPLVALTIAACITSPAVFAIPAEAIPVYRVKPEVAQGISGNGLEIVLAPGQVVSLNFSKLGERVISITPGDRSQFVYTVTGAVVNLRRIKPLHFQGEYSGGQVTTLNISTLGPQGQTVYPITIRLSDRRPRYSVIEITPDTLIPDLPDSQLVLTDRRNQPRQNLPAPPTTTELPPIKDVQIAQAPAVTAPNVKPTVDRPNPPEPKGAIAKVDSPIPSPKATVKVVISSLPKTVTQGKPKTKAKLGFKAIAKTASSPLLALEKAPPVDPPAAKADVKADPSVQVKPPAIQNEGLTAKVNPHDQANAIARGLLIAKNKGHVRYQSVTWDKTQDVIRWLRRGKTLAFAVKQARLPIQTVKKILDFGTKKNAQISQSAP